MSFAIENHGGRKGSFILQRSVPIGKTGMNPMLQTMLPYGHVKWQGCLVSHYQKNTRIIALQKLSVLGRASLFFRVCTFVVPAGLLNIVTATIRAWLQRLSIRACVRNAVARALMTHIPADQIQTVLPSMIETYRAWVAPAEKSPLIQILPDGTTRLLWLG